MMYYLMKGAAHHCLVVVICHCVLPASSSSFSILNGHKKIRFFKAEDKIMFIRVEVEEVPG